jgi:hypothetical protein
MLLAVLALLAAPASPSPAAAYDPLAKGSMGLSFFFPGGGFTAVGRGSTVGVTYLLNDNLALRMDFGLDAVVSPSGTPVSFSIGGSIRSYQIRKGQAAVYFYPAVTIGRAITDPATNTATVFINLQGGIGAEYFFADHFSVAGQLGIGLDFGNIGGPAGSSVSTSITTSTSGLIASVYF